MKTIPGHENYAITEDGRVWSKPRGKNGEHGNRWLKPSLNKKNGYLYVSLSTPEHENRNNRIVAIHVLVAITYLSVNYEKNFFVINHKNRNKIDNRVANLEFVTSMENMHHWVIMERHNQQIFNPDQLCFNLE